MSADALQQLLDTARAERDAFKEQYYELLYAVGNKYPNETRHETALRYITQAEAPNMATQGMGSQEGE